MHVAAAMKIALRIAAVAAVLVASRTSEATLTKVPSFGANPGALSMYEYVPAGLPANRPIVIVLHGCTQTAAAMENAGWNQLADAHKFAVLYPEQQTANNPVRCFNWAGEYGDTANLVRGQGENQSIISMIDQAIATHASDPTKVFIVGFSAGGAFAAVMLATWPEKFAAGAIMSGVPYRCATSVAGAYSCQSPGVTKTGAAWGDLVRGAATFAGPRPRLQIWHGANDSIVVPANQVELVKQWTNTMGVDDTADETETIGSVTRAAYKQGTTIMLETYRVPGMGHATAVGTDPLGTCTGVAGAYFEDRGICATLRAARFLGLLPGTGGGGGTPDTMPPTVAIVSPANGDTVTGQVTIVVAANDDSAMGSVGLAIDGTAVGADDAIAPYQFEWDAGAATPGTHTLVATAHDAAGNTVTTTAMVTVPQPGGGGGSGSGSGSGDGDDPPSSKELPGCGLDAGGGGAGGCFALALALALRRRRPTSAR
jgi:poly(hydroxyalkanoate) depolymerase family esterase